MKFQSGNKYGRGRPKGSGFVMSCRRWGALQGWNKLKEWANGDDPKLAFEATKLLLAYGYGRPATEINLNNALESLQGTQIEDPEALQMLEILEGKFVEKGALNLLPQGKTTD